MSHDLYAHSHRRSTTKSTAKGNMHEKETIRKGIQTHNGKHTQGANSIDIPNMDPSMCGIPGTSIVELQSRHVKLSGVQNRQCARLKVIHIYRHTQQKLDTLDSTQENPGVLCTLSQHREHI
jgi:hypothetical protein